MAYSSSHSIIIDAYDSLNQRGQPDKMENRTRLFRVWLMAVLGKFLSMVSVLFYFFIGEKMKNTIATVTAIKRANK